MTDERSLDYTRRWAGHDPSFLTLKNGSRLRYLQVGEGPPLLLMHTVRTQLDLFQRLIPKLTEAFTIYALDLPGFGWSDIVPGASTTEPILRAQVAEFITALGLRDVTLAGESIGAVLALTLAADPTVGARRAVAFNTYDYYPGLERANLLASFIIKNIRLPVVGPLFAQLENRAILAGILRGGVHAPAALPDHLVDEMRRVGRRRGYSAAARSLYKSLSSFVAARALYPAIRVPVVMAYGDHDWSKPAERRAAAALVADHTFVTIPHSGHFSTLDNPDACARILLAERP